MPHAGHLLGEVLSPVLTESCSKMTYFSPKIQALLFHSTEELLLQEEGSSCILPALLFTASVSFQPRVPLSLALQMPGGHQVGPLFTDVLLLGASSLSAAVAVSLCP